MGKFVDETGNVYGNWTVLKRAKKNNKGYWLCRCTCGTQRLLDGYSLRSGHSKSCGCEGVGKTPHVEGFSNKLANLTNQRFGRLTVLYRTPNVIDKVKWHCLCECGNECDVLSDSLTNGRSKSCGCLRKELTANKNKKNIVGQRFGMITVLEELPERDHNKKIVYKCKCDCGRIKNITGSNLLRGDTMSCGCANISHGEFKIRSILLENNIDFIPEYHPDVDDIFENARYDFYIPNYRLLIEYDGKQHFEGRSRGWGDNLEDIQRRDELKNQWAMKHGYILIRIPYTRYKKLSIKDLMPETSTFIYTEAS